MERRLKEGKRRRGASEDWDIRFTVAFTIGTGSIVHAGT